MSNSSLGNKTVRPGSLNNYAYYYSNRRPPAAQQARPKAQSMRPARPKLKLGRGFKALAVTAAIAVALIGLPLLKSDADPVSNSSTSSSNQPAKKQAAATAALPKAEVNYCAGNAEAKFIRVSVEKRHLWACEGEKLVMDTPVITGLRGHAETETPPGTYKIYGKMTDTRLTGQDSRGAWDYPVHTWMPFLDNQYGTYGFHDATWRPESEFGTVSPDTDKASHGCIELPLSQAKWLYEWSPVGTVLTVEA